jgi:hypothetical protein
VAEEPEDVLPQKRHAALRGVEERGAQPAVGEEHDQAGSEHRRGQDDQERRGQDAPDEDRHPHHGHPRGSHPKDGHDEIDGSEDGCRPHQDQAREPQVHARAELFVQRRVAGPAAGGGPALGHEAGQDRQAADRE